MLKDGTVKEVTPHEKIKFFNSGERSTASHALKIHQRVMKEGDPPFLKLDDIQ